MQNSLIKGRISHLPMHILLTFIIFIEGFVSIAIEIITIRQLLPVAGGSVIVTSLIIGIFLLFLALGYRHGGTLVIDLQKKLRLNFLIASIWFGIGLSYPFILNFFYLLQKITGPHILLPLIIYLLLIIAPLIFILGQTVPITINMIKRSKSVGEISGNAYALSTLGSFLGATLTTLLFMQVYGVAWTVFLNFLLLIFLWMLVRQQNNSFILELGLAIFAIWIIYSVNIKIEKNLFVLTNNYANYQILDENNYKLDPNEKILSINNSLSSYTNERKQGFPYIETIKTILFDELKLSHAEILVLGAGAFTLSSESTYGNQFTYVDIDGQLKDTIAPRFNGQVNGKLIVDDARHFLHVGKKLYDVIVVDAYSNIKTIPAHLLTKEYIQDIKTRLTKNGMVIFNMIANPTLTDRYSKRIDNTIRSVFKNCMARPMSYANEITNILYLCNYANNEEDRTNYTDNLSTATTDSFVW